jgi:hypothetical protein
MCRIGGPSGPEIQYVPGLSLPTRGKKIFLILCKNFRVKFFASFETPISVIKKSFSTQMSFELKRFVYSVTHSHNF